jgi:rRNA biogenesis protein RRP5
VKAIVLSIDLAKRRISLGLKPSYFKEEEEKDGSSMAEDPESGPLGVVDNPDEMSGDGEPDTDDDQSMTSHGEAEDDDDSVRIDMDVQQHPSSQQSGTAKTLSASLAPAPLKLQGGFQWSGSGAPVAHTESDSSSDETDEEQSSKRKKRRRKEIEQDLTADLATKTPESNADFERLLLGSPNSSYLWVQYMSFQLQLAEVEKAREVGCRAFQTINFREEKEKLNVWIALLNLENVYGTDETLESTFKDAARHNDSKTVHLRLADILDEAQKHEVSMLATTILPLSFIASLESRRAI